MRRETGARPRRRYDGHEQTPHSIEQAKQAQQLEREQFEGCTGLELDEDGHVTRFLPQPLRVSA